MYCNLSTHVCRAWTKGQQRFVYCWPSASWVWINSAPHRTYLESNITCMGGCLCFREFDVPNVSSLTNDKSDRPEDVIFERVLGRKIPEIALSNTLTCLSLWFSAMPTRAFWFDGLCAEAEVPKSTYSSIHAASVLPYTWSNRISRWWSETYQFAHWYVSVCKLIRLHSHLLVVKILIKMN